MISKKIIGGLMILILALSMQSCAFLEGLFKDTVVTTIDNVKPDQRHTIVPADFGLLDEGTSLGSQVRPLLLLISLR